jgi:DNA modification methylase
MRYEGAGWVLTNNDCVEGVGALQDETIDLSVYSPPFISLYTYTASERDMGNCASEAEFFQHFGFLIHELLRVTKPGRNTCCHVAQVPAMLSRDGYIGMKDFRGKTIEAFQAGGWIYHGEVCIDKDPQVQAIRTKSKSLLFVQLRKDASWLRPALADYILVFRKPGENQTPIQPDVTNEQWIEWARPVWYGIRESDTLQVADARSNEDERHICPLQLGTIERCIRLWSNPGELVLSPFAGIGSEGYEALRHRRRFIGFELKPQYAAVAARNLHEAEQAQESLFSEASA